LNPSISGDGRYVLFLSQNRLDPAWSNSSQEMYLRDRQLGTTVLIPPTATGALSNTGIVFAEISRDGRYVAFETTSTNILSADANGFAHDVFVRDLTTGATTLVSASSSGTQGNQDSFVPSISANGRFVAFHSWANNLVPGDTNTTSATDVFLRDVIAGTTTRLSVGPGGEEGNHSSEGASISDDGTAVVFTSRATNLIAGDGNGVRDVFLYAPPLLNALTPGFRFDSPTYSVGEAGGHAAVTVTRTGNACATVSVDYAISGGSATSGDDFTAALSGTLAFGPGVTSRTISIDVIDDEKDEPNETIIVGLSAPTGGLPVAEPVSTTVTIVDNDETINTPPDAVNDAASTTEDSAVVVAVLANDTDRDGDTVTIASVTQPSHGATAAGADGKITYVPTANFFGTDGFSYTIADGHGGTDTATVAVTVTPVNDPPIATDDSYSVLTSAALTVEAPGVLANDTDVDNPTLTVRLLAAPQFGTVSLRPDGSFTYTPQPGTSGTDTFRYEASDGAAAATATASIVVTAVRMSGCRPIVPTKVHRVTDTPLCDVMGEPFRVNRRLTVIDNNSVPCVNADTMEATRCVFTTGDGAGASTGHWMEARDGARYAVVGQPIGRDGSFASGNYVVGTIPDANGDVACVGATSRDAAGSSAPDGSDMVGRGMVEFGGGISNASGYPIRNYANLYVGTSSDPHPDGAQQVSLDRANGVAWYTGEGAALNDVGGIERDAAGVYLGTPDSLHLVVSGGIQVPAAKRPATKSFPAPGRVDVHSPITWLVANPYVTIANDGTYRVEPPPPPTPPSPPRAAFTADIIGKTVALDATWSFGPILRYEFDFSWTPTLDYSGAAATVVLPLNVPDASSRGTITLRVIDVYGLSSSIAMDVNFKPPIPKIGKPFVPK
jgi:hypothetical protein